MAKRRKRGKYIHYETYINSSAWRKKRRQRLKKDNHTCTKCKATGVPLDVHHRTYKRLGREWLRDLRSLCRPCHDRIHNK